MWLRVANNIEEIQGVVATIRGIITGQGIQDTALFIDSVAQYSELVAAVNDRLAYCLQILQGGFLWEAKDELETPPSLLEVAAMLDFPERGQLDPYLSQMGITLPPHLDTTAMAALAQVYHFIQTVDALHRKYRLLVLGRAPLAARIIVLRQMVELLPQVQTWQDDLIALENARLRQISRILSSRDIDLDEQEVAGLVQEVTKPGWRCPIPEEIVRGIQVLQEKVERSQARKEIPSVVASLLNVNTSDLTEASRLAARFKVLAAKLEPEEATKFWSQVGHIVQWVDQCHRLAEEEAAANKYLSELVKLLQADAPLSEIRPVYTSLKRIRPQIPENLEEAYQRKVREERQLTSFLLWTVIIAAIVLVLFLVTVARR
jgi:hypothetical protein